MDRYAQLFALHGISVGVLPLLKEKQLIEMGITDETDRKKVMRAIDKIKNKLPTGGTQPSPCLQLFSQIPKKLISFVSVASWLTEYHKPMSGETPYSLSVAYVHFVTFLFCR